MVLTPEPADYLVTLYAFMIEYSYVNCLAECRATTIRAKCDCIPYYFPQNGRYTAVWYDTSWPGTNMTNDELLSDVSNNDSRPCECMPDCTLHRYALESSQSVLNRNNSYNKFTSL